MSPEARGATAYGAVALLGYAVYVAWVLVRREPGTALAEAPYVVPMLVVIGGGALLGAVVQGWVTARCGPEVTRDERDVEVLRAGELAGRWALVAGAVVALGLALAESAHFWIANVLYLAFVLSAVVSTGLRLAAYRWGLPRW